MFVFILPSNGQTYAASEHTAPDTARIRLHGAPQKTGTCRSTKGTFSSGSLSRVRLEPAAIFLRQRMLGICVLPSGSCKYSRCAKPKMPATIEVGSSRIIRLNLVIVSLYTMRDIRTLFS